MVCNASCTYPEFNLSTSSQMCKNDLCRLKTVVLTENNISCISNTDQLVIYPQTSSSIWNQTSTDLFQKVQECDYGGCIHKLVCAQSCTGAKCDPGLYVVYSSTGMVCDASCTYEEFNLSTSQ